MKKIFRIIGVALVAVVLLAAIIVSTTAKSSADHGESVWDQDMTMGNSNAKNYYIIYSDLACPYCVIFEEIALEHEDEFQDYLKKNDIFLEIRLSDFLYEYGTHDSPASRLGAVATYCAKDEGKFWDYYNHAIHSVAMDFLKAGMGGVDALNATDNDYWINLGKDVGLGDNFVSCVTNETPLDNIIATARKTAKLVSGMPYFKFNNQTFSGFDPNGGWDNVLMYLDAGLKK